MSDLAPPPPKVGLSVHTPDVSLWLYSPERAADIPVETTSALNLVEYFHARQVEHG